MGKRGIALSGNLIVDFYKEIDIYPDHSTLTTIRNINRETGGLVCNCAQGLSQIDPEFKLAVIGRIGADEAGDFIVEKLSQYPNIDQSRLIRDGGTSFTDAMIDLANRTRTYFHFRGANSKLAIEDIDLDHLGVNVLHIGYILLLDSLDAEDQEYGTRLARLLERARKKGIKTSIDIVSEVSDRFSTIVPPALKYTDYAIVNEYEASKVTGIPVRDEQGQFLVEAAFEVCRRLLELGVRSLAVIHSREGAVGISADGARVALPALEFPREKIVSTIGAGDAFLSGCLYGTCQGYTLEQSIKLGIAAATTSLSKFNATDGILPGGQLLDFYDNSAKENWPGF